MSLTTDTTMQVVPANYAGSNNNSGFGWGGDWMAFIVLFLLFGMFGWGGFGGIGGFGGGMNGGVGSEVQRGFDHSAVVTKLDGITQGICDSTYALNNAITNGFNNTNMGMMQGFNGVERGFCSLSSQLADCCCGIQRSIDGVNFHAANNTRDIIDNQNSNTRAILDYLCQDKISTLQNENQALRLAASQSNQNAVLMAAMDANKAEILRRSGHDCPTAAYIVQPPTAVSFPTNCCGTFTGFNNGCGC